MPTLWWTKSCRRANGYFGCENTYDAQGNFDGYSKLPSLLCVLGSRIEDTWLRFLVKEVSGYLGPDGKDYVWYKFNVFTRWVPDYGSVVLIFDPLDRIRRRMLVPIFDDVSAAALRDPFLPHIRMMDELVQLQDVAVWAVRDRIRQTEKVGDGRDKRRIFWLTDYWRLRSVPTR
jgi:hypothetical protein